MLSSRRRWGSPYNRPFGLMTPTSMYAVGICMKFPRRPDGKLERVCLQRCNFSQDRGLLLRRNRLRLREVAAKVRTLSAHNQRLRSTSKWT
jgi:hypothetical protein